MALEHSCPNCGRALARVRAPLDPIYHLPIVVCPTCNTACVRRRHPVAQAWRTTRHVIATAIGLGWRVLGCAMLVGISIGIAAMLSELFNSVGPYELWRMVVSGELDSRWWDNWAQDSGQLIVGVAIAWCIAAGAALTIAFAHIRHRWIVWSLFATTLFGSLAMNDALNYVSRAMNQQQFAEQFVQIFWDFDRISGWLAVGLAIAIAGIPLGRVLRRPLSTADSRRWRARLRRARKRKLQA